jgi:hypothetical protein
MTAEGHPVDEKAKERLRSLLFPKDPPYGKWTLADELMTKTAKTYLEESATVEELIEKLGKAAEVEKDQLLRIVQLLVKEKAEKYLSELKTDQ